VTKYRVVHNNLYTFQQPVSRCSLEARLKPLDNNNQQVEFSQFVLRPLASTQHSSLDEFGNQVNYFEINRQLRSFELSAIHTVVTQSLAAIDLEASSPWEHVVDQVAFDEELQSLYMNDSATYTQFDQGLNAYARVSFVPGRPLLAAAFDLMQRIHDDFHYDSQATTVDTTAAEAFRLKRGVCQDFSHIGIACLRSLDLLVRYVSGYVDTKLSATQPRRLIADVSHAWFSVYDPNNDWVDFDPTNNRMPGETYIRLAYGRDYTDVAPLKGQVDCQGQNQIKVSVDLTALG
jgi:transglutaminase-like putative cysteine protease